ncbi:MULTISPECIES: hypothetical protein [Pandoraea]|uniref:hypothetical protein n=1 Tax=Pandoraea capi TaxID=2508286 RepID=UPI001F5CF387|nr:MULTISPECIES: hypothetical protein [Pandoraea]
MTTLTNKDKSAYFSQKSHAKQRGITFNLTLDEWYDWWIATGHYHQRGRNRDCYVMARYNDTGPYELGNIYCCTVQENDLPPTNRASRSLVKFVFGEEDEHEEAIYGTANHRVSEGS